MASTYGARHGLIGYDRFRIGLNFRTVQAMLRVESEDPRDWKQKSRGCVLGLWHSIKMGLYQQACDIITRGLSIERLIQEAQASTAAPDIQITRKAGGWAMEYLTTEARAYQAQLPLEGLPLEEMAALAIVAGLHIKIIDPESEVNDHAV